LFVLNPDIDANAQRKYIKDLTKVKPDLHAYNLQKEAALGLPPGTLVPTTLKQGLVSSSSRQALASTSKALSAAESLYRDANTLAYADNKPSEEAIDRVVGKMNAE
jgi:pre-mRNA-splicing factor SYF2